MLTSSSVVHCCPLKNWLGRVLFVRSNVIRPQSNLARRVARQSHSQHSLLVVPESEHKKERTLGKSLYTAGEKFQLLKITLAFWCHFILFYFSSTSTTYIFLLQQKRQVSKGNDPDSRMHSTMFETNVLAAMSAETASFPHAPYDQINGEYVMHRWTTYQQRN